MQIKHPEVQIISPGRVIIIIIIISNIHLLKNTEHTYKITITMNWV